jgi:hypothetical protein
MTVTEFPDWFSAYAKPNFEKYLIPLAGVDNLKFLQLGVYTGDASRWLLENVLTGDYSRLTDVDTWEGSDEEVHESIDFEEVFNVYKKNILKFTVNEKEVYYPVNTCRTTTISWFLNREDYWNCYGHYDFIYIDADHTAAGVLVDAELSWQVLKPSGLLAFDDYQWGAHLPASKSPKLGIDLFLERHAGEYEILEQGLQVWLRKL